MGIQAFYSWKILLSCPPHQHGVCKCQLNATATFRGDQPRDRKCYERIVEKYRPLRQSTAREETTKGKAGALPPAVYTKQQDSSKEDLLAGLKGTI